MIMMKLKPCPFCGGEAGVSERYDEYCAVRCITCGARTNFSMTKKGAIELWNRREPMDKIVEQLKQLSIGTVLCDKCEYREKCDDIQEKYNPDDDTDLCTMVAKSLAIEIVKSGGAV